MTTAVAPRRLLGLRLMKAHVETARRWALVQAEAIAAVLGSPPSMFAPATWARWDLHVHLLNGWEGMDRVDYTAAIAVAMVSFFTSR